MSSGDCPVSSGETIQVAGFAGNIQIHRNPYLRELVLVAVELMKRWTTPLRCVRFFDIRPNTDMRVPEEKGDGWLRISNPGVACSPRYALHSISQSGNACFGFGDLTKLSLAQDPITMADQSKRNCAAGTFALSAYVPAPRGQRQVIIRQRILILCTTSQQAVNFATVVLLFMNFNLPSSALLVKIWT